MGLDNPLHILVILVVALMVFGAKRLPEMGRSMGEGMRGFKQAITGETAPTVPLAELTADRPTAPAATPAQEPAARPSQPVASQTPVGS